MLFFDDQRNCVLVSSLNHFMTNGVVKVMPPKKVSAPWGFGCGPNGEVNHLPAQTSFMYLMVFGQGIHATFKRWGDLLRQYYGVSPKDRYLDVMTSSLGYFTDNGAYYYYNPLPKKKYDQTLLAVKAKADELRIPYRYYHLDSWWYRKSVQQWNRKLLGNLGRILGGGLYGGTIRWEPDPEALDMPLVELSAQLGTPFSAHNRWYAVDSPYTQEFHFVQEGGRSMPDDPKFWQHIMKYCQENRITVYEQD